MPQCSNPGRCFYCDSEASHRFESCNGGTCKDCLKMLLGVFMPAGEIDESIRRYVEDDELPLTEVSHASV